MTSYYASLSSTQSGLRLDTVGSVALEFNKMEWYRSQGTLKAPTAITTTDSIIGGLNAYGYTGSAFRRLTQVESFANGTGAASGRLTFGVYNTTNNTMENLLTLNNGALNVTGVTGVTIDSTPSTNISIGTTLTSGKVILGQDNTNIDINGILNANDGINGTLLTAAQPNITSLGALTTLSLDGNLTMNGIITSATGTDLRLRTIASQNFYVRDSSNNDKVEITNSGKITLNATTSQQLLLQQNGTNRLRVDTTGEVLVQSASGQALDLVGEGGRLLLNSDGNANLHGKNPNGNTNIFSYGTGSVLIFTDSASSGAVGIGVKGDTTSISIANTGAVTLNTAASTALSLRQNTSDRVVIGTSGNVAVTPAANQNISLTTANVAGTSGSVAVTTGTGTNGGSITLNTQGTTAGAIDIQQNGTNRLMVSTVGAITMNTAASQALTLQQNGTNRFVASAAGQINIDNAAGQVFSIRHDGVDRYACSDNSTVIQTAAASTNSLRLRPNEVTQLEFLSTDGSVVLNNRLSGAITVATAPTSTASTNSGLIVLSTGNATGTTSNSGAITFTTGTATGSGGNIVLNTQGTTLGTINLQQNATDRLVVSNVGAITLNTAASQALSIQQNTVSRMNFNADGSIDLTAAAAQPLNMNTANNASGASGAVTISSGTATTTGGAITLNAQGTTAGAINVQQNGTNRIAVSTVGAITANTAASQALSLQQNGSNRVLVGTTGAIDISTAASQQLRLQQSTNTRLDITSAGAIALTPADNQNMSITTANVAGTSGSILMTTGTGATGGAITLNTQGTTLGAIQLQQGATNRVAISTVGAITLNTAASQALSLQQNATDRFVINSVGAISLFAAASQPVAIQQGGISRMNFNADGSIDLTSAAAQPLNMNTANNASGNSGNVIISSGTASGTGGAVVLNAQGTTAGTVDLRQNNVNRVSVGSSGSITLNTAASQAMALQQNGISRFQLETTGEINMTSAAATGINITSGNNGSGASGNVVIRSGTATTTGGAVVLDAQGTTAGTVDLRQNNVNRLSIGTGGAITLNTAASQAMALQQGGTSRFQLETTGEINMTSAAASAVNISSGNNGSGASGNVTISSGTATTTGGNITLNARGTTTAGEINVQQNGTNRMNVTAAGSIIINCAASQTVTIQQGGQNRISMNSAGIMAVNSGTSQSLLLGPNGISSPIQIFGNGDVLIDPPTSSEFFLRYNSASMIRSNGGNLECTVINGKQIVLQQGGVNRFAFGTAGNLIINSAASQSIAISQNSVNRLSVSTAGAITLNTAASQALALQRNSANVFSADTNGAIAMDIPSSQRFDLKQNGSPRISVSETGAVSLASAAGTNVVFNAGSAFPNIELNGSDGAIYVNTDSADIQLIPDLGRVIVGGGIGIQFPIAGPDNSALNTYIYRTGTLAFSGPFNSTNANVIYVVIGSLVTVYVGDGVYAVTGNNTAAPITSAAMPYAPANSEHYRENLVTINNNNSFFSSAILRIYSTGVLQIGNSVYDSTTNFAAVVSPNVIGFRPFTFSFIGVL